MVIDENEREFPNEDNFSDHNKCRKDCLIENSIKPVDTDKSDDIISSLSIDINTSKQLWLALRRQKLVHWSNTTMKDPDVDHNLKEDAVQSPSNHVVLSDFSDDGHDDATLRDDENESVVKRPFNSDHCLVSAAIYPFDSVTLPDSGVIKYERNPMIYHPSPSRVKRSYPFVSNNKRVKGGTHSNKSPVDDLKDLYEYDFVSSNEESDGRLEREKSASTCKQNEGFGTIIESLSYKLALQIESLQATITKRDQRIEELEMEAQNEQKRLQNSLTSAIEEKSDMMELLNERVAELLVMEKKEKVEEERMQRKCDDLEKNLTDGIGKSQNLLLTQINSLQALNASNLAHVVSLQAHNQCLEAHIISLQAQTVKPVDADSKCIPAIITDDVKHLASMNKLLVASVDERDAEIGKKQIDLDSSIKENATLSSEIARVSRKLQEAEALVENLRGESAISRMRDFIDTAKGVMQERSIDNVDASGLYEEMYERDTDLSLKGKETVEIKRSCSTFETNRNLFESKSKNQNQNQSKSKSPNLTKSISSLEAARKNTKKISDCGIASSPVGTRITYLPKGNIEIRSPSVQIENLMEGSPSKRIPHFLQKASQPPQLSPNKETAETLVSSKALAAQKKLKAQLAKSAKQQWERRQKGV
jgi:hypothetical protein